MILLRHNLSITNKYLNKLKKYKQTFSDRKLIATVFWDCKGILLVEFMMPGTIITATTYSTIFKYKTKEVVSCHHYPFDNNARPPTAT